MLMVAARLAADCGLKVMFTVQLAEVASEAPQLLVMAKLAVSLRVMLESASAAVPVFVSVTT
jgi:hypothetical protein